jgi:hypothetical protein
MFQGMKVSKQKSKLNVIRPLILVLAISLWSMVSSIYTGSIEAYGLLLSRRTVTEPSKSPIKRTQNGGLVVDIMSVGSKTRLDYQETQRNTFAKHKSVRFFFNITEDDDADLNCSISLVANDSYAIANFCRPPLDGSSSRWGKHHRLMRFMEIYYELPSDLEKKTYPSGWICAQARPTHGFGKVVARYRAMKDTYGDAALPDYLLIADDDTYVNMDLFVEYMSNFDGGVPRAIAGCLIRTPSEELNFSFPYGGYGTIFSKGKSPSLKMAMNECRSFSAANLFKFKSKGALELYMRPVNCSIDKMDNFSKNVCSQVDASQIGEKALFKDGMSVSDLQIEYASFQPYTKYKDWTTGFCLHSDWVWGYFSNFYHLAKHSDDTFFKNVPQDRMEGYNQSELYGLRGICNNRRTKRRRNCDVSSPICHYVTPNDMLNLTTETLQMFPSNNS